jgi:hypothetical protein
VTTTKKMLMRRRRATKKITTRPALQGPLHGGEQSDERMVRGKRTMLTAMLMLTLAQRRKMSSVQTTTP